MSDQELSCEDEAELRHAAVVLCSRNGANTIRTQLDALDSQVLAPGDSFEVVVVANNCSDETVSIVCEWSESTDLHVTLIEEPNSIGASKARNIGTLASDAAYILCCDDDDRVHPRWVSGLVAALETCDIAGGSLVPWSDQPLALRFAPSQSVTIPRDGPRRRAPLGASIAYRRSAWERASGWDDALALGSDDSAFTLRVQATGGRLGFAPEAVTDYRLRSSFRSLLRQRRNYARSRARFALSYERATVRHPVVELMAALASIRYLARSRGWIDLQFESIGLVARLAYAVALIRLTRERLHAAYPFDRLVLMTLPPEAPFVGGLGVWIAPAEPALTRARGATSTLDDIASCLGEMPEGAPLIIANSTFGFEALMAALRLPRTRIIELVETDTEFEATRLNAEMHGLDDRIETLIRPGSLNVVARDEPAVVLTRRDQTDDRFGSVSSQALSRCGEWTIAWLADGTDPQ